MLSDALQPIRTRSENLFEAFCAARSMPCRRITETAEQRPDYEIDVSGLLVLAEIKQFDPNDEERAAIAIREAAGVVALGGRPGERIRRAIHAGNRQLRQLLGNRLLPAMVVVYNNSPCTLHTDPYAVTTAMEGLDVIDVEVPANPSERPRFGAAHSGPGRTLRPDVNASTSALAVLTDAEGDLGNELQLSVFHNRHARTPLDPDRMRVSGVTHWRLREGMTSSLNVRWERY